LQIDWNCSKLANPYLREYITQVNNEKGCFVDFMNKLRSTLQEPQNYKYEKMRPNFKKEHKKLWEKAESLMILAIMYHGGLLELGLLNNMDEFIKSHF